MTTEIVSAIIQALGSIIGGAGAALLAVLAATKGLENWKKEAPGRRRLEVAEQCLVQAYAARDSIMSFAAEVAFYASADLRLGERMQEDERHKRQAEVRLLSEKLRLRMDELQTISRVAELYFGREIYHAHFEMRAYEESVRALRMQFNAAHDNSRFADPTAEKQNILKKLKPAFGTEGHDAQMEMAALSVRKYEAVLKPHLSVFSP